ncbi:MAG: hypothetical protein ACLFOY_17315 [Desulfatibacillaceae bacterium]
MTTVHTDVATIENSPTPDTYMDASLVRGSVRCIQAAYETAAAGAGTEIRVCRLYKGERVLLGQSHVMHDALGAGVTLAVGDDDDTTAADADRYLEAASAAAAGVLQFNDDAACIDKVPYEVGKECWLTCTTGGAAATGTIRFEVYVCANN